MTVRAEVSGMCVFVVDSGPPVHRRPIWPGQFIAANTWQDTDISGEDQAIKDACIATWTPSALAAYKADNPWVEPVVYTPEPHLNGGMLIRFAAANPVVVHENIGLAGVARLAKGRFRISHVAPMPTSSYSAFPDLMDVADKRIRVTARTETFVEVRIVDAAGVAADATEASVKIERVIGG